MPTHIDSIAPADRAALFDLMRLITGLTAEDIVSGSLAIEKHGRTISVHYERFARGSLAGDYTRVAGTSMFELAEGT